MKGLGKRRTNAADHRRTATDTENCRRVSPLCVRPVHVLRVALRQRHAEYFQRGKESSPDQFLSALIELVSQAGIDLSRCASVDQMVALLTEQFRRYPRRLR